MAKTSVSENIRAKVKRAFSEMESCYPATRWQDAFPSGNGRVGALVYGHIRSELVVLNHEALWVRSPKPKVQDIFEHISELRALLAAGSFNEAAGFFDKKLKAFGYTNKIDTYHPAFDFKLKMETQSPNIRILPPT